MFGIEDFRSRYNLAAINSINWARILAQISYYFYAYFRVRSEFPVVQFCVPTGNFGDILAGFYAKMIGLDIGKLVICTNENDILTRFLETGTYDRQSSVLQTYSPAMDILISSNFERAIWYLTIPTFQPGKKITPELSRIASETVKKYMDSLSATGKFSVDPETLERCREVFGAYRVSNLETELTIHKYYHHPFAQEPYILDPHSAVGVHGAEQHLKKQSKTDSTATVVIGTASPGKFPDVVMRSINKEGTSLKFEDFAPKGLVGLEMLPKRVVEVRTGGDKVKGIERVRNAIESTLKYRFDD